MSHLYVKNWDEFQQYKDRDPKWIKVYRALLDDYEFDSLNEVAQIHLVKIWLLAAKMGNKIPNDPQWIGKRIGAKSKVDIEQLITLGFLCVYENVQKRTDTYTETEKRQSRKEGEKKARERGTKPGCVSDETWADFKAHRKSMRKPLTETAIKRIENELIRGVKRGHKADDMLGEAMAAGWQGFRLDWYENRVGGDAKTNGPTSRPDAFLRKDGAILGLEPEKGEAENDFKKRIVAAAADIGIRVQGDEKPTWSEFMDRVEDEWKRACRLAKENGIEPFKGHAVEKPEQFLKRVQEVV